MINDLHSNNRTMFLFKLSLIPYNQTMRKTDKCGAVFVPIVHVATFSGMFGLIYGRVSKWFVLYNTHRHSHVLKV